MGIQFTGLASGLDTQSIIADLMKVERTRVTNIEKDKTMTEWKRDAYNELNAKIYSFYKTELFEFKSSGTYNKKTITSSNTSSISVNSSNGAASGTYTLENIVMAKGSSLTGNELSTLTDLDLNAVTSSTTVAKLTATANPTLSFKAKNSDGFTDIVLEATDTVAMIVAKIDEKIDELDLDMTVSYDSTFDRIFLNSTTTGTGTQIELDGDSDLLDRLGFAGAKRSGSVGTDASFDYNGETLSSTSNTISINNLSFNIVGEAGDATLSVSNDMTEMYDSVKSFINKYNELLNEINTKLDAESAREYEPLTSEEKEAMTDTEIELWEGKIKDSLLRRDTTLTSMLSSTRSILTSSYSTTTTGSKYTSLADLGIVTGNYTEKGQLHIQGDLDDNLYGLKENKLQAALESDPDDVMELLTHIGTALYDDLTDRMKSTSLSSAFNIFNDKMLSNDLLDYDEDIFDMEDRLSSIESRYYAQFTAMEQAIQQSNSTSDWLSQQLANM